MAEFEAILKETWPRIRERHLYPELPDPHLIDGEDRVALEIKNKKIALSREFVHEMSTALEPGQVMEGLLDHAVSHYLYCPWDFATHMRLYTEAKKVVKDKQMAQRAADYFMDVVADTHCVYHKEDCSLPTLYRHLKKGIMDDAMHALYQNIWGVDLGVEVTKTIESYARKLSRLPYLDRPRWTDTIRRFTKVVQGLLEMEERHGGLDQPNPMGEHSLDQYSNEDVERGLKELAMAANTPAEFKEIVDDFQEELMEALVPNETGMGEGPGSSLDADVLFYMKLSDNYSLPIRQIPMKKSGSMYPHNHTPWELGKPFNDIDPWTSFGKIMPGITQIWQRREGEIYGDEEGTPDCIVMIDSSGSMTNPRQNLSYAVLGAACACDAYLRNDAKVAVYNFSDAKAGGSRPASVHRKPHGRVQNALPLLRRRNEAASGGNRFASDRRRAGHLSDHRHADHEPGIPDPVLQRQEEPRHGRAHRRQRTRADFPAVHGAAKERGHPRCGKERGHPEDRPRPHQGILLDVDVRIVEFVGNRLF